MREDFDFCHEHADAIARFAIQRSNPEETTTSAPQIAGGVAAWAVGNILAITAATMSTLAVGFDGGAEALIEDTCNIAKRAVAHNRAEARKKAQ